MSHSLKVAQIGRRLAEYFNSDLGPDVPNGITVNPDVVETAALAHDIGHPPFGHAGELELQKKIEVEKSVDDGFEGNPQSFRVVTRLCVNTTDTGLNLTLASLNAILKYPWPRGTGENEWGIDESKKWGVYESDMDAFREARTLSNSNKRRCSEADLMDWADDLAYAVHDLEDFYRTDIIPLDQLLKSNSREREDFVGDWASQDKEYSISEGNHILDYIADIAGDSLQTPFDGTELNRYDLNELASKLISRYLGYEEGGVELQNANDNRHYLHVEGYLDREVSLLKHATRYYVVRDNSLAAQQRGQREVISNLFDVLFNAVLPKDHDESEDFHIIPHRFREQAREEVKNGDTQSRSRLAADIITGMTEIQAIQMNKRLTGSVPRSVQNRILR